jgi:hypothetical protein
VCQIPGGIGEGAGGVESYRCNDRRFKFYSRGALIPCARRDVDEYHTHASTDADPLDLALRREHAVWPRQVAKEADFNKRKARCRNGKLVHQAVRIIKDADRNIATGCVASPSETRPPREAAQALADYIARKYQPERNRRDIDDIDCADALSIYLTDVGQPGDQFEIEADWSQPKIIPLVAGTGFEPVTFRL